MRNQESLQDCRTSIDVVDRELLCLLNRRAELAVQAGKAKISAGLPICDGQRELEVIASRCRANAGPLDETAVAKIFRLIIRETRLLEMRQAQKERMIAAQRDTNRRGS